MLAACNRILFKSTPFRSPQNLIPAASFASKAQSAPPPKRYRQSRLQAAIMNDSSSESPKKVQEVAATGQGESTLTKDDTEEEEGLEEELEAERAIFESLFSTRRPKDGWAGLSSGLKSVGKGVGAGLATLVAAPIAGARQDGVKGFLGGLATGVASAVALPVTGVCVGAYQMGRGLANSGEAMKNANQGMHWDEDTREWSFYLLDSEMKEVKELEEEFAKKSGSTVAADRKVKDTAYYDLLKVSPNATSSQLKKAYYKEARICHPDKNPDDPKSAQKFQELGHAYQILSSEDSRAAYDKNGVSESGDAEMKITDIDPKVFFAVMFGSEAVRPYIGELWIANKADSIMKDQALMEEFKEDQADSDTDASRENAKERSAGDALKQRKREVECAINIRQRIAPFVDGSQDEAEFIALCQAEAADITKGMFGDVFCSVIGFVLEVEADEFLGTHNSFLGVEGQTARMKKRANSVGNKWKIVSAGISAARAGQKAYSEVDKLQKEAQARDGSTLEGGPSPDENAAERVKEATDRIEESLPVFLDLAWAVNTQDITRTLKGVCRRLFVDAAEIVPLEVRLKRAEGLKILGREFNTMGKLAMKTAVKNIDVQDIRTRAEVAAMTTLAKAQGQEVSDEDAEQMIRQSRAMAEEQKKQQQQQQQAKEDAQPASST